MRLKYLSALSVLAFAAAVPLTGFAGFEFIAPGATSTTRPNIKTDMPVVAVDHVATTSLDPMPRMTDDRKPLLPPELLLGPASAPMTPLSHDPVALKIDDTPSAVATKPDVLPPSLDIPGAEPMPSNFAPDAAPLPPGDDNAVVQGFGNKVTLAMALQQIVPSNYRYAFDAGVSPAMKITWSGGKPWKQIVGDIARTNRLNVDIVSNVVAFRLKTAPSPVTTVVPVVNPTPVDALPDPMPPVPGDTPVAAPMPLIDAKPVAVMPAPAPSMDRQDNTPSAAKASIIPQKPKVIEYAPVTDAQVAAPENVQNAATPADTSDIDSVGMPAPITASIVTPIVWDESPKAKPLNDALFDQPTIPPAQNPQDRRVLGSMRDTAPSVVETTDLPPAQTTNVPGDDMAPMPTSDLAAPSIDTPTGDQLFETIPDTGDRTSVRNSGNKMAAATSPGQQKKNVELVNVVLAPVLGATGGFAQESMAVGDTPKLTTGAGMVVTPSDNHENLGPGPEPLDLLNKDPDPIAGKSLNNNIISSSQLPPDNATPAMVQGMPDVNATRQWTAQKNETLRQTLTRWSETVGVSLVWSSEYDYPLQTDLRMDATYPEAVRTILGGFSRAQPRPLGRFFKNSQGGASPVLIVETQRLTD